MKKIILTSVLLSSMLLAGTSSSEMKAAAALKNLDCEFEDCTPKQPQVKIVEKVVTKEVIKEVPVEKVVYKDRPVHEVTVPAPDQDAAPTPKKEVATNDITFNKAFFDVNTPTQAPIQDYIKFTKRGSFDINAYVGTVSKIKEDDIVAYIYGNILVPDDITTDEVYMYVGDKYHDFSYGGWKKDISYDNGKTNQNADYFLAKVKTDNKGRRYVPYKISIHLGSPWKINAAETKWAPNTYSFQMAPKVRGYKNKFENADIYIENID